MTDPLFRADAYMAETEATVLEINDRRGIVLDRTVFYATGGGQPGDSGNLRASTWRCGYCNNAVRSGQASDHSRSRRQRRPARAGDAVTAAIDWDRRYRHMRIHTALHLLSVVLPFPVTGGSISDSAGRLDFDVDGDLPAKDAIEDGLNALVAANHPVSDEWISDEELLAKPDLVKTMKVQPPIGTGRVRLVRIGDIDLQPCGGTHVRSTSEIGRLALGKIESKGRQNRRVRIAFAENG